MQRATQLQGKTVSAKDPRHTAAWSDLDIVGARGPQCLGGGTPGEADSYVFDNTSHQVIS